MAQLGFRYLTFQISNIDEVCAACAAAGVVFHSDAVQAFVEADLHYCYRKLSRALRVLDDHIQGTAYADADLAELAERLGRPGYALLAALRGKHQGARAHRRNRSPNPFCHFRLD